MDIIDSQIKYYEEDPENEEYKEFLIKKRYMKTLLEKYIREYDTYHDLYETYKTAKNRLARQVAEKIPREEELSRDILQYVPEPYMSFREFVSRNEILRERGEQKGQKEKREKESI